MQEHPLTLVLYTKPDCPLCDVLRDDLHWLRDEFPFILVEYDISAAESGAGQSDTAGLTPAQAAQLRNFVPVLAIDGTLYYPPHDLLQLRTAVVQAMRSVEP